MKNIDDKKYNFGIDLGGTNIVIGLFDDDGNFIGEEYYKCPTYADRDYKLILKDMADGCYKILAENPIKLTQVNGIGIGIPGKCDVKNKIVISACNIKSLDGINIETEMRKFIDVPINIENDANCAAVGEKNFGVSRNYANSIMITLGTGIGGGIIINHQVLPNTEIGHHVIVLNGEDCTCGRKGCWETYASATGLIREAKKYAKKHPESKLNDIDENQIDAKFVFDVADIGDKIAMFVVYNYVDYLSEGIANLINIFDPDVFVIGGGISNQGKSLLRKIRPAVQQKIYANDLNTKIVQSKLGNYAGIIGAASLNR